MRHCVSALLPEASTASLDQFGRRKRAFSLGLHLLLFFFFFFSSSPRQYSYIHCCHHILSFFNYQSLCLSCTTISHPVCSSYLSLQSQLLIICQIDNTPHHHHHQPYLRPILNIHTYICLCAGLVQQERSPLYSLGDF